MKKATALSICVMLAFFNLVPTSLSLAGGPDKALSPATQTVVPVEEPPQSVQKTVEVVRPVRPIRTNDSFISGPALLSVSRTLSPATEALGSNQALDQMSHPNSQRGQRQLRGQEGEGSFGSGGDSHPQQRPRGNPVPVQPVNAPHPQIAGNQGIVRPPGNVNPHVRPPENPVNQPSSQGPSQVPGSGVQSCIIVLSKNVVGCHVVDRPARPLQREQFQDLIKQASQIMSSNYDVVVPEEAIIGFVKYGAANRYGVVIDWGKVSQKQFPQNPLRGVQG